MEQKLEFKDIAGYLSYDLNWIGIKAGTELTTKEISIYNYSLRSVEDIINKRCSENKPILRPLSDLYKTITHNGEDFVPIVELAKIHRRNPKVKWWLNAVGDAECLNFIFGYNAEANSFYCGLNDVDASHCLVCNQYQLFHKLNEWKIDYRGLIDAGLAIDCNTLDINPYK